MHVLPSCILAGFVCCGLMFPCLSVCLPQEVSAAIAGREDSERLVAESVPLLPVRRMYIERLGRPGMPDIIVSYPVFSREDIDSDIEEWMKHIVASFETDFAGQGASQDEQPLSRAECGLTGTFRVYTPSARAVGVMFELWMYTGSEHPGQDIITLNYSLLTGQRLDLYDTFEDVPAALSLMSEYSRKVLARRIGGGRIDTMIRTGTEPQVENFSSFALVPGGVRVYFQPYQVAPWEAGSQVVDIPLESLSGAHPLLALWGK